MPGFALDLPILFVREESLVEAEGIGAVYSMGLDGFGYLLSTLDQEAPFEFRSYEVQAIPLQTPRIDDQGEPGEQTLAPWWTRAQHTWHEGAGQHMFDSAFSSRYKFTKSKGVDIWNESRSEVKLLKDTSELRNDNVDDHHVLGTPSGLILTHNGNIRKDVDPDTGGDSAVTTHNGTPINSITSDGESVYAAFSGGSLGIKKVNITTFAAWVDVNTQTAVELIAFVKGRLFGAKLNALYEYNLAVTTTPEPLHTDRATSWRWTGITEAGPAIYFSGFAGERSEIYAARLTAQDIPFASVATVGALRSVWQAPEGEQIRAIKGYIGKQVLIGTSEGVRVGTVSTGEGDLEVSELLVRPLPDLAQIQPVLCFEPQEQYAWFGWSRYDGTSSGLGRLHLGNLGYASDLMFTSQGDIKEVTMYADRLYFVTDEGTTSRIIKQHATNLVASGYIDQDHIRFGTTERKIIRYFDTLITGSGTWDLQLAADENSLTGFANDLPADGYHEEVLNLEGTNFAHRIILKRDAGNATLGPELLEWRIRSEPRALGRFRYLVPILCYDFMVGMNEREFGYTGQALAILERLKQIYRLDRDVFFLPPESSVPDFPGPVEVKMEDLRFKEFDPPAPGGRGFGGIILLVLREVR